MANILSQDEIDALLSAAEKGELQDNGNIKGDDIPKVVDYNFRKPSLITKDQLREFTNLHENFSRDTQTSLSLMMRAPTEFKMVSTEQQQYSEFVGSLPTITHLAVFSARPLPGLVVVEINLGLIFGIVDMRLGGTGSIETSIRQVTDVEVSIIEPIIKKITSDLQASLKVAVKDLTFSFIRNESNPEYLQAAPGDAPLVVLGFDAKIGQEINGIINICYPVPMIMAILDMIAKKGGQMDSYYGKKDVEESRKKLMGALQNVPLRGKTHLGSAKVYGRDLLELSPGDILVLDDKIGSQLTLSICGKQLFQGIPGRIDRRLCLKISQRYDPDKK